MSQSAPMLRRTFIYWLSVLLVSVSPLAAGLTGDYDEGRWTLKPYGGDGTVDWLGDTVLIDSGYTGNGSVAQADVVIRASRSGTFYFSWTFYGGTSTGYRLARLRNETATALANRLDYAEGTDSFTAGVGDLIGFRVSAPLDEFPAMAEIFEFFAPGQEPAILAQPVSALACQGEIAIFSVIATNAVDYQWQFKGQNIPEENFEDLVLRAVPPADAGNYRVIIRNPLGTVTSQAVPMLIRYPPAIAIPPTPALTLCAGQTLAVSVTATGTSLGYQWQHGSLPVAGATGASLTLPSLALSHSGEYRVSISNSCGVVLSTPLVLNVITPPAIIGQPAPQTRLLGESVSFAPLVASPEPFQCQWRRNGTDVPGATASTLTLSNLQPADAGAYCVVVANSCGVITSADATLTLSGEPMGIRIVRDKEREVAIEVQASIGRQYVLEVSSDATNWTALQTNWLVIAGSPLFHDVADRSLRFYRVRPVE